MTMGLKLSHSMSFFEKLWFIFSQRIHQKLVNKNANFYLKPNDVISHRPTLFGYHESLIEKMACITIVEIHAPPDEIGVWLLRLEQLYIIFLDACNIFQLHVIFLSTRFGLHVESRLHGMISFCIFRCIEQS